jgi:hypothetical protein
MAARRRLADTLLLNWIVTLSLLLILVWRATVLTYNLRVKTRGFEGFDTYPIPSPSLPSEDDKLEVFDNGIYYRGVLYPNSTFTFFWTERAR